MESPHRIDESILRVGDVVSIEGRSVRIQVDKVKNASHLNFRGKVLRNVSVGGYLKISKGFETIICKIEGEYTEEDKPWSTKEYKDPLEGFKRILKVSLVGFYEHGKFKKGVKEMPLVGNTCYLLNSIEVSEIHEFVSEGDTPLLIGCLANDKGMEIKVGVNSLFASHIGIFGNTGSGKSYTLAKLYHSLFFFYKDESNFQRNASFFLIDFNGEYARNDIENKENDNTIVEDRYKRVFRLSTNNNKGDKYPIPFDALYDTTLWTILLEATDKTQVPFLRRSIEGKYLDTVIADNYSLKSFILKCVFEVTTYKDKTLEKNTAISMLKELQTIFDITSNLAEPIGHLEAKLEFHGGTNSFYLDESSRIFSDKPDFKPTIAGYFANVELDGSALSEIQKIRLKIVLNYYGEILRGFSNKEHLAPLIKRLAKRFDDVEKVIEANNVRPPENRNLTIVSLKDVNIHMRKILPLLFTKYLYEEHKKVSKGKEFLNIIIDEAHNILSPNSNRESEQWKDYRLETFEEVIKEGRKFGVFLTIASQRPFDISPTVISQLHNYFIHRLINNKDIEAVERNLSYLDKVSVDSLSILATGTCVLAGIVAQMPIIIDIEQIPKGFEPFSETIKPTYHWK